MKANRAWVWAFAFALACTKKDGGSAPLPVASASSAPSAGAVGLGGRPACEGARLDCSQFDSPEQALAVVLEDKPLVLSVGEAHAQKGATVASSAKRFTDSMLPSLAGKASDLLVELMNPPTGCNKTTADVKTKQKVVTEKQSEGDQNEYVQMGDAARKLGVVPDLLRPTCEDLAAIADAGADSIDLSLRTIERLTETKVLALRARDAKSAVEAEKIVVTYGGAIHNDLVPSPESAAWSFGPALSQATAGRYVELDLYVPEFIQPTDAWRRLEWYASYDAGKLGAKVTLFRPRPHSFVLIFAATAR